MALIYTLTTQPQFNAVTQNAGTGQTLEWDSSSNMGGQSGDVKVTFTTQNIVYIEPTFTVLGSTPTDLRVRWYINTTGMTLGATDSFAKFGMRTSGGTWGANVHLNNNSGTHRLLFQTLKDGGAFNANTQVDVPLGVHWVETWTTKATSDVAADATTRFYVDTLSSPVATHSSYDLYDDFALYDRFRIGGLTTLGPIDAGTSGILYTGKIAVRNDSTAIGAFVPDAGLAGRGSGGGSKGSLGVYAQLG